MAHRPTPWNWKNRSAWFVTIDVGRHNLGQDKKTAFDRFYAPDEAASAAHGFAVLPGRTGNLPLRLPVATDRSGLVFLSNAWLSR